MNSLVAFVLAATIGPVAFKAPGGFVITDRSGKVVRTVKDLGGKRPESLAVSPDEKTMVFTAFDPDEGQPLLYKSSIESSAELLGTGHGFHAQPTFTNDGQWVYFIHHPDREGGAPGSHGMRAYGQLWRIRINGQGLEQLTDSPGCKSFPELADSSDILMTHADCAGQATIERVQARSTRVLLPMTGLQVQWPKPDYRRRRLIFARRLSQACDLLLLDDTGEHLITRFETGEGVQQLAWINEKTVVVQLGSTLIKVDLRGSVTPLLDLSKVLP